MSMFILFIKAVFYLSHIIFGAFLLYMSPQVVNGVARVACQNLLKVDVMVNAFIDA